jgi:hypothetical protein
VTHPRTLQAAPALSPLLRARPRRHWQAYEGNDWAANASYVNQPVTEPQIAELYLMVCGDLP